MAADSGRWGGRRVLHREAAVGIVLIVTVGTACHPPSAPPAAATPAPAAASAPPPLAAPDNRTETAAEDLARILGLLDRERWAEARPALETALAKRPDDTALLNGLGWLELRTGNHEVAATLFRRVVAALPDVSSADYNLAVALVELKRVDEADSVYRAILEKHPDAADALGARAWILFNATRFDEAEQSFRRALQLDPEQAWNHQGLGMILWRKERPEEAMASLRTAARLKPGDALIWLEIGRTAHLTGNYAESAAAFERANRLNPGLLSTYPSGREMWEASKSGVRYSPPGE